MLRCVYTCAYISHLDVQPLAPRERAQCNTKENPPTPPCDFPRKVSPKQKRVFGASEISHAPLHACTLISVKTIRSQTHVEGAISTVVIRMAYIRVYCCAYKFKRPPVNSCPSAASCNVRSTHLHYTAPHANAHTTNDTSQLAKARGAQGGGAVEKDERLRALARR